MSTLQDCPICLCSVNTNSNFIITNCGHSFHSTCLLIHVHRNGLTCPCCRHNMAENEDSFQPDNIENNTSDNTQHITPIAVHRFKHNGINYLRTSDDFLYDYQTREYVGQWDTETETIVQN